MSLTTRSQQSEPTTGRVRRLRRITAITVAAATLLLSLGVAQSASATAGSDRLATGEQLGINQRLTSQGGRYALVMQNDGNLVVVGPNGPTWSSNTSGSGASRVVVQGDGNLVMYKPNGVPVFSTGTNGSAASLVMQSDGNLVEYTAAGPAWWTSSPGERAIQWFYNHKGATNYEGKCELAVENAFGTSGKYATARADWNARTQHGPVTSAPRGTLVFYSTSSAGHVAISIGNGRVLSSSAGGKIGDVSVTYFQNPLGWAVSPW